MVVQIAKKRWVDEQGRIRCTETKMAEIAFQETGKIAHQALIDQAAGEVVFIRLVDLDIHPVARA